MENWNTTKKCYGLACFYSQNPLRPHGDGDACQFFSTRDKARQWAEKAIQVGRFKFLALYDSTGGNWTWSEEW